MNTDSGILSIYMLTNQNSFFLLSIQCSINNCYVFNRYRSEGKSIGALPGANSTAEVKTYPMIKVTGYQVNIQLKKISKTKIISISILHDFRGQQPYLFLVLKQTNLIEHIHTI